MNKAEQEVQVVEYNQQAKVLQSLGKSKEAYEYYNKANNIVSMNVDTYINKASLLIKDGLYDLAEKQLQLAMRIEKHDANTLRKRF